MKAAAKNLTSLTLELGGKSPVIIDENANMTVAAKRIVFGKTFNAGQVRCLLVYFSLDKSEKTGALLFSIVYSIHTNQTVNTITPQLTPFAIW